MPSPSQHHRSDRSCEYIAQPVLPPRPNQVRTRRGASLPVPSSILMVWTLETHSISRPHRDSLTRHFLGETFEETREEYRRHQTTRVVAFDPYMWTYKPFRILQSLILWAALLSVPLKNT